MQGVVSIQLIYLARRCALSLAKAISIGFEIGVVGRREHDPGAARLDRLLGLLTFVRGEVVQDADIALRSVGKPLRERSGRETEAAVPPVLEWIGVNDAIYGYARNAWQTEIRKFGAGLPGSD